MAIIARIAEFLKKIFKYHKKKIFLVFISSSLFTLILFPYDDLADVVTIQVSKLSDNQVFIQFDHLGIDFFPTPGINLEKVEVQTPQLPTIKADELTLSPSIAGLLTFKPGLVARAEGFLEGNVSLKFKSGEKVEEGVYRKDIELRVTQLELSHLKELVEIPIKLTGKANLNTSFDVDPTFRDQPQGEIEFNTGEIKLPPSTIPTYYGPLSLPAFNWTQMMLKGRMVGGKFIIEMAELGGPKDAFNGQLKGSIDVTMNSRGGGLVPQFGAYELKLKLNVTKAAQESLSLFLGILDGYKTLTLTGASYAVRISGSRFGVNPSFSALAAF
ncbi:MAG: type II secretion system protein GspN [Bdellovibrionales bacterium]|nr:type II secretion system protein GspN [Bdellovibrionales bacterium]